MLAVSAKYSQTRGGLICNFEQLGNSIAELDCGVASLHSSRSAFVMKLFLPKLYESQNLYFTVQGKKGKKRKKRELKIIETHQVWAGAGPWRRTPFISVCAYNILSQSFALGERRPPCPQTRANICERATHVHVNVCRAGCLNLVPPSLSVCLLSMLQCPFSYVWKRLSYYFCKWRKNEPTHQNWE